MYEVSHSRFFLKSPSPLEQFWRIGMIAKLLEGYDLRANRNEIPENFNFVRATFDGSAARARRLKANKED